MDFLLMEHHHRMKIIILVIVLISFGFKGFSQKTDSTKNLTPNSICLCCGPSDPNKQPLWLINGEKATANDLIALNPIYIQDIKVFRKNEYKGEYQTLATYGVIHITLKKGVKPISMKAILAKNKIDVENRKLPIYFNDKNEIKINSLIGKSVKDFVVKVENNTITDEKGLPFSGKYLSLNQNRQ